MYVGCTIYALTILNLYNVYVYPCSLCVHVSTHVWVCLYTHMFGYLGAYMHVACVKSLAVQCVYTYVYPS